MMPDLHHRRDLAHLICAENAIDSARAAAEQLITEVGSDLNHPLFTVLQEVLIIGYGRAFSEMRPFGRLDKTTKWAEFHEPKRQAIHDKLMEYRNQMIAHTDFKPANLIVNPPGALRSDGNRQSSVWGVEPVSVWLVPADIHDVKNHLDALAGAMFGTINAEVNKLYGSNTTIIDPFELLTQADIDTLKAEGKKKPTP